jgi:hypothetical protein
VNHGPATNSWERIAEDPQGALWFLSRNFGVGITRYDGHTWQEFKELAGREMQLRGDRLGRVWVAVDNVLAMYDGTAWQRVDRHPGLPAGDHRQIFEGRAGNIWVTTHGVGISRWDGSRWTTFTFGDGEYDDTAAIRGEVDGHLWVLTMDGRVLQFDGQAFKLLTDLDKSTTFEKDNLTYISSLLVDKHGEVWVGTNKDLRKYTSGKWETLTIPEIGDAGVNTILEDREGILWFGSGGRGLFRYDGTDWQRFFHEPGYIRGSHIWDLFQDTSRVLKKPAQITRKGI